MYYFCMMLFYITMYFCGLHTPIIISFCSTIRENRTGRGRDGDHGGGPRVVGAPALAPTGVWVAARAGSAHSRPDGRAGRVWSATPHLHKCMFALV